MNPLISAASVVFAGLAVALASIGSGIDQDTLFLIIVIASIFLIGLITFFSFYSYKEKILGYDEDANQNSKKSIKSTESNESKKSTESKEDIPYIRPYPINGFDINLKSINGFSIEEESSWVWNLVVAKIVCEFIEIINGTRENILYARIYYFYDGRLLPVRRIVSCKVSNHLRNTTIRSNDIVLLEFNETNKSYKIFRIIHANDSI